MAFVSAPRAEPASSDGPASVPLTIGQKGRLLFECVPLIFWVLAFVFVATLFDDIYGSRPPLLLLAIVGLSVLFTGYEAANRLRDLASGVAVVREDLLERIGTARRGGRAGQFKQLGHLRVMRRAVGDSVTGLRHRVYYSPASKIVWRLEPLESL